MGSKRNILEFVRNTVFNVRKPGQRFYDIFGGSAVVAGSLRNEMPTTCNDIQTYTSVLAGLYLNNYCWKNYGEDILEKIVNEAETRVESFLSKHAVEHLTYSQVNEYLDVKHIEGQEKNLVNNNFETEDHLFVKFYSGTYWSFEQCVWIDALSSVARSPKYKNTFLYNVILSSLMFAMAYCSQSTGHYAQYRDLTADNTSDVLLYRKKSIVKLFRQKFNELKGFYPDSSNSNFRHEVFTGDYLKVLQEAEPNSLIYADPPYQFVHYSRFYHALETLVRYDYPEIKHKGRYRDDRHQSPFCIRTKVSGSFESMFEIVYEKNCELILSYSDTGMITLVDLMTLAKKVFKVGYSIKQEELAYIHSTMGRQGDKSRPVKEILLIISRE